MLIKGVRSPREKKILFRQIFPYKQNFLALVLLSALVERCFVSRMRDFYLWLNFLFIISTHFLHWVFTQFSIMLSNTFLDTMSAPNFFHPLFQSSSWLFSLYSGLLTFKSWLWNFNHRHNEIKTASGFIYLSRCFQFPSCCSIQLFYV